MGYASFREMLTYACSGTGTLVIMNQDLPGERRCYMCFDRVSLRVFFGWIR